MDKTTEALNAIETAIDAVRAMGESKKVNAYIGKLLSIKADLKGIQMKNEILNSAPGKRVKKGEL